jgi:hypothetical protein
MFHANLTKLTWKEGWLLIGLLGSLQSVSAFIASSSYHIQDTRPNMLSYFVACCAFINSSLVGWTFENLHMSMPQLKQNNKTQIQFLVLW